MKEQKNNIKVLGTVLVMLGILAGLLAGFYALGDWATVKTAILAIPTACIVAILVICMRAIWSCKEK